MAQKRHFTIRNCVPEGRTSELYILALDAPSLSLIPLESTTQQKNLLTATTQPLSSSQASSLPSQHLLIYHYQEILTNTVTRIHEKARTF